MQLITPRGTIHDQNGILNETKACNLRNFFNRCNIKTLSKNEAQSLEGELQNEEFILHLKYCQK